MTVEIFLRKPSPPEERKTEEDILPDSITELEMIHKELEWTSSKLRESTDLLTEEFRRSDGEEAREYYEYIQDNLEVLKQKSKRMNDIQRKINQIRGVFDPISPTVEEPSASTASAGGLMDGHMI